MRPLSEGTAPLDVAVLVSESDARLRYLLDEDPERGRTYTLVGAVASHPDGDAVEALRAHDIPVHLEDIDGFYAARDAPVSDLDLRAAYDERVAGALADVDPDLVVCSGYRFILTAPVLDRFAPGIVSAHHADLTVREDGDPKYPGLRATRDAILDGRAATRETTHVVTADVDRGPPLVWSRPFSVHEPLVSGAREYEAEDVLDAYVYAHRRWMMRAGGGPALAKTIALIADGRVSLQGETAHVDGEPAPYRLGEAPRTPPASVGGD